MKNVSKNVASFTANGNTYEIVRNRYLQAEYNRIAEESAGLTPNEERNYAILNEKVARLGKLAEKVNELEDAYYETFDDGAGALYEKAKAQYDKMFAEVVDFELKLDGITKKVQSRAIETAEKVLIRALQLGNDGEEIRTEKEANDIWCGFVDEVGKAMAVEWLLYFITYITGNDAVEEDPFVAQAKAKAEQRANMKKGYKLVK